jgi:hypothetical protein
MALVSEEYPTPTSSPGDPVVPSPIPVVAAFYLPPVTSPASFVCDNWKWMLNNEQSFEAGYGEAVGFPLRAWAQSEAAALTNSAQCSLQQ